MASRRSLDHCPGPLPVIRTDGERVDFFLDIVGVQAGVHLVIRCDPDGRVWASIEQKRRRRRTDDTTRDPG